LSPDPTTREESTSSDARGRRVSRKRLALRAAFAALLLASLWLFLLYLAQCDREGQRTLFQLSAPMAALVSAGAFLFRTAEAHARLIRAAALGLLVGVLLVKRESLRRSLPTTLALLLLPVSAALFLPPPLHAFGFLASLAAGIAFLFLDEPPAGASAQPPARAFLFIPLGIAVSLRFFSLAEVPRGFSQHAVAHHTDLTLRYLEDVFPMLSAGQWGAAARWVGHSLVTDHLGLTCLLGALGFKVIGVSFVTARLISAAFGCLSVLAAYFLGTQLRDRRLGLLFSFLLAVSPWHITISRYGDLEHVLAPLQLLLTLAFYVAAVRDGRLSDYLLTAAFLGLSWFIYASNILLPIVVGIHLALLLALRPGLLHRDGWKICAVALLFGLMSYAPFSRMVRQGLLMPSVRTGYQDTGRIPLADTGRNWRMAVAESEQLFVHVTDPWFAKPGGGLNLTETACLLPGVLLCVGGLLVPSRRVTSSLILIALAFSTLPGILAPDVSYRRLFLTATMALLLASLVLSRSLDAMRELGFSRRFRWVGFALFAAALTAVNTHIQFDRARALEEEGAIYLTEVGKSVGASLGHEFVYVYAAPGTPPRDYHRYVRLAAYEPLQEFVRRGVRREELYEIVFGKDVLQVLQAPRRIEGRFRVLAEESLVSGSAKEFDLRRAIREAFPQAEEERLGPAGRKDLTSWRIR
jgi:hypothetical protein